MRLSLLPEMRTINYLIFLLILIEIGRITRGTMKVNIAGQPTIIQIKTVPPINPKGNINPANIKVNFAYIELKSLLKRFVILPSSEAFAENDVSLDTLEKRSMIIPALSLQEIIGMV